MNLSRNFVTGRMNKEVDERLVPNGEYIDALNIRMGSTEKDEMGVIENSKGNTKLTTLQFQGSLLTNDAKAIGAFEDGAEETIYWFVHDPSFSSSPTGKIDLIVSYDTKTQSLTYHVITINDGGGSNTTLNFSQDYVITGVNKKENLLFWTDNYNQPRFINVTRNYPYPSGGVDQTSAESLLVIKKPPVTSPSVQSLITASQDNYLEDRFICFAYRYRYQDNDYSATSQFSLPAFLPGVFNYSTETALNQGMLNTSNSCVITYNSGGPLVTGVDLLFKDMNSPTIKVIEKLDKDELGLSDNTDYTYTFTNNKVFTILPDSEILRMYDNVPLLSQAQTMMGNRLMYGNYVEGRDLVDLNRNPVRFDYTTSLISTDIGDSDVTTALSSGNYAVNGNQTIASSVVSVDLQDFDLVSGAIISLIIRYEHSTFSGTPPFPTQETAETEIEFTYILPQSFNSVFDLATSADFIDKVGTVTNIQTVANSCSGTTFTDIFNCAAQQTLDSLEKYESGIINVGEPIRIVTSPASDEIGFQIPAIRYVDDPTGVNITQSVYEYYEITYSEASFAEIGNPRSLKSNRDYEVAIVYMDEFNRSSTALVSRDNTEHVPCSLSDTQNRIQVNIPTTQRAPSWATRYKFAIKPDKKDYDVIYSNLFFRDTVSGCDYFLLEGQNSRKIEEGDELYVKADPNGPLGTCVTTTVLEKEAQMRNFLDPLPTDSSGTEIPIPAGTYMKIRANNFSTEVGDLPVVSYGKKTKEATGGSCPNVSYRVNREDPNNAGQFIDYDLPAGSRVKLYFKNERIGKSCSTSGVEARRYKYEETLTVSQDYANFKDWWDGDNVQSLLNGSSAIRTADCGATIPEAQYDSTLAPTDYAGCDLVKCFFRFYRNPSNNELKLVFSGTIGYAGKKKKSKSEVNIEVIRAANIVVFESDPQDAEPDLWYESSESFAIDAAGQHSGNVQNQDFATNTPAIINTDFFNCYSFGNGVESYKVQDSMIGKELVLGNRATSTSELDYRETLRFADITYSGIYNEESNVNKLNEFNLGLLNYKNLEQSFGPIFKMVGRESDILVLQEDKISYVLTGKNILSDAGAGSSLMAVPQVLGTQVARVEEFGISHHPESFAQWGADKFFTDAKRGVVIQLKGNSGQSEQLNVISDTGMKTWFRDLFNTDFYTQKLGGYDPYMNEYVLTSNDQEIPLPEDCIGCNTITNLNVSVSQPRTYCIDFGQTVGDVTVTYNVISTSGTFNINALYNSGNYSSGNVSSSGSFTFSKDSSQVTTADITVTATGSSVIEVIVGCPEVGVIQIVQFVVTSNNEAGQYIHSEYGYNDGTYISPTQSSLVSFQGSSVTPIVSRYSTTSTYEGAPNGPSNGSTVTMSTNKINFDDFEFNPLANKFMYMRSNTLYENNQADVITLLTSASVATPIYYSGTAPTKYSADFTMPSTGDYLYMIWDLREATTTDLCYGADLTTACCGCTGGGGGGGGGDTPTLSVLMGAYPVCRVGTWDSTNGGTIRFQATLDNLTIGNSYTSLLSIAPSTSTVHASLSDFDVNQTFTATATSEVVYYDVTFTLLADGQITPQIELTGTEGTATASFQHTGAANASIGGQLSSCGIP